MAGTDILSLPPVPADQRVRYGSQPEQFADLYFAKDKSHAPLAINIHGGYWRARYDLAHASPFCGALAGRGINTVSLEYRRVGSPGGGWPRTFEDIRTAYRYLVQCAGELGIEAAPLVVLGHSAGAQLALCLAAHEESIRSCASLAGVLDLRRAWELHLSNDAVVEYLGGTPEQVPEHYREASPIELPIAARQMIVHGTADLDVPIAISREYVRAKKKRGEQVEFVSIRKASHFDLIDPRSNSFQTVARGLAGLLKGGTEPLLFFLQTSFERAGLQAHG
ncbi:MAG: alpha/beta hydrolase family protein [Terriglobales bacterium]